MAVLAWLTVLTGAYIIYPWYRAVPPPGAANLAAFSAAAAAVESCDQRLALHRHGVEGARRLARAHLHHHGCGGFYRAMAAISRFIAELRAAVLGFVWISLLAAGIAGFFGAMINKNAPVEGGATIHIMQGDQLMSVASATTDVKLDIPNGSGAAAVLAAGVGSFLVALFALLADQNRCHQEPDDLLPAYRSALGRNHLRHLVWLAAWVVLHVRWRERTVAIAHIGTAAFILLIVGRAAHVSAHRRFVLKGSTDFCMLLLCFGAGSLSLDERHSLDKR